MGTVTLGKLDSLYWMGRYIERVYQSISMYKETYDKLIDQWSNIIHEPVQNLLLTNFE